MLSKDYQDHSARNKDPETGKICKYVISAITYKKAHITKEKNIMKWRTLVG